MISFFINFKNIIITRYYQSRSRSRSSESGFTLIELLVVMMVIAIITSFALPNFSSIQNKAKESSVKSLAHSVQLGIESYFMNQGSYPTGTDVSLSELSTTLSEAGVFGATPKNPFTGEVYSETDTSGKIVYTYDSTTQSYTLQVYGVGNTDVITTLQNR